MYRLGLKVPPRAPNEPKRQIKGVVYGRIRIISTVSNLACENDFCNYIYFLFYKIFMEIFQMTIMQIIGLSIFLGLVMFYFIIKYILWWNKMKDNAVFMTQEQFRAAYPTIYKMIYKQMNKK